MPEGDFSVGPTGCVASEQAAASAAAHIARNCIPFVIVLPWERGLTKVLDCWSARVRGLTVFGKMTALINLFTDLCYERALKGRAILEMEMVSSLSPMPSS